MKKFSGRHSLKRGSQAVGYLFLLPWLIGLVVFALRPLCVSLYYSFCNVKAVPGGMEVTFSGFANYADIWVRDIFFIRRVLNFLLTTVLQVPIIVVFALLIALLLNVRLPGRGLFRTVFFLPVIVVSGPLMDKLFAQGATTVPLMQQQGFLTTLQTVLPSWLAEPVLGLFSRLILILWCSGIPMQLFLAGIQKMDLNMVEAAKIDGASGWEIFWKITLPNIKPLILLNAVYTLVFLANADNNDVIVLINNNMLQPTRGYGFAAAMAWMYVVVVLVLLGTTFWLLRERDSTRRRRKED